MRVPVLAVKILLVLLCALFVYSLYERQPHVDDAWLGEHAWYQSKLGYVRSELMRGVTHQEERTLIHHKLLTLHGSLAIRVAGFSAPTLKAVSLLYFLLFIALCYWYMVSYRALMNRTEFMLLMILLLAHPLVFELAFVFRPEVPMMFYGFLGFVLVKEAIIRERRVLLLAFAGGVAAGLCFTLHLNGLIFPLAGAVVLLFNRRYAGAALFIAGSIVAGSIYLYDFTREYGFTYWLAQITDTPFHTRTSNYFSWKTMFVAFSREHLRFFHSPPESSLSILLIFALIMGWRALKKMPVISLYSLFLIIFLAFIAIYKTSKYMVAYLPFIMIIIVMIFKEKELVRVEQKTKKIFINGFALFFIMFYLAIAIWSDVRISLKKFDPAVHREITQKYFSPGSEEKRIAAPMEFVFNEIGRYDGIHGLLLYNQMLKIDSSYFGPGLFGHFSRNGIDAAYLNGQYIKAFGLGGMKTDSVAGGYRVLAASPEMLILSRER